MGQTTHTPNPSAATISHALSDMESSLCDLENLKQLCTALAASAMQFSPDAVYPIADLLGHVHRALTEAFDTMHAALEGPRKPAQAGDRA